MIVLAETTPDLQLVSLLAEFASRQPRPELKHILRLAEGGMLSEQVVSKRLEVSKRAAFNILSECASLGLIDGNGALTPEGNAFFKNESSSTYVPEHGCFDVVVSRHPAFGQVLLHIERTLENVPMAGIVDQLDVTLRPGDSTLGKANEFKFRGYLTKNRRGGLKSAEQWSARLTVQLTSPEATPASGKLVWKRGEAFKDESALTLLTSAQDLWNAALRLIPESVGTWKMKPEPHLAIKYPLAKPEEAIHFRRPELRIPGPHTLDSDDNAWTTFTLRDIPIGPANVAEAKAWVDALFFKAIQAERSYLSLAEATELYRQTSQRNPILDALAPSYQHSATLRHAGQIEDRQAYWALQAPADLEDQQPTESALRIRPAERMSFQSFLAKIVGPTPTDTHFILYDKFALREPNWLNVPAFLEACQGLAGKARLTILHLPRRREDGADPKPCGAQAAHRSCYEVFGQTSLPHDRYLFTVSGKEIKAWQLSNSPLAAKAGTSTEGSAGMPLEWPALMVAAVNLADLEAGFQTFLHRS